MCRLVVLPMKMSYKVTEYGDLRGWFNKEIKMKRHANRICNQSTSTPIGEAAGRLSDGVL